MAEAGEGIGRRQRLGLREQRPQVALVRRTGEHRACRVGRARRQQRAACARCARPAGGPRPPRVRPLPGRARPRRRRSRPRPAAMTSRVTARPAQRIAASGRRRGSGRHRLRPVVRVSLRSLRLRHDPPRQGSHRTQARRTPRCSQLAGGCHPVGGRLHLQAPAGRPDSRGRPARDAPARPRRRRDPRGELRDTLFERRGNAGRAPRRPRRVPRGPPRRWSPAASC